MAELKPGYRIGPYVISYRLPGGKGGMADAYVATRHLEQKLVQEVVLKIMKSGVSDEQTQDFFSEAINNEVETLKRLHHPHIVHLYPISWGTRRNPYIARVTTLPNQPWFYAMEYLRGGSIKQILRDHKSLPVGIAVEITYQLSLALDFMHSKGVSHLDIKPENVLLRYPLEKGYPLEAVLIDFGIARRKQVHTLAGSLPFMPPERVKVLKGSSPPEKMGENEPVDIYGLGVTLFQMLTGKLPFSGRTKSGITTAILTQTPTAPSTYNRAVPPPLDEVVWRMLDKEPQNRPRAAEIHLLLDEALAPPRFVFQPLSPSNGRESAENTSDSRKSNAGNKKWLVLAAALFAVATVEAVALLPIFGKRLNKIWGAPGNPTRPIPAATVVTATMAPTLTPTSETISTKPPATESTEVTSPTAEPPTATPLSEEPTSTPIPTFTPIPAKPTATP